MHGLHKSIFSDDYDVDDDVERLLESCAALFDLITKFWGMPPAQKPQLPSSSSLRPAPSASSSVAANSPLGSCSLTASSSLLASRVLERVLGKLGYGQFGPGAQLSILKSGQLGPGA